MTESLGLRVQREAVFLNASLTRIGPECTTTLFRRKIHALSFTCCPAYATVFFAIFGKSGKKEFFRRVLSTERKWGRLIDNAAALCDLQRCGSIPEGGLHAAHSLFQRLD